MIQSEQSNQEFPSKIPIAATHHCQFWANGHGGSDLVSGVGVEELDARGAAAGATDLLCVDADDLPD